MNVILFDYPEIRNSLLPFTFTRSVGDIRIGIFTIAEKWEKRLGTRPSFLTERYLSGKFPLHIEDDNLLINGALCPDKEIIAAIKDLKPGVLLKKNNIPLAIKTRRFNEYDDIAKCVIDIGKTDLDYLSEVTLLRHTWDIFQFNGTEIRKDFELIKNSSKSHLVNDPYTKIYAPENVFIGEGAQIKAATINAETGPVYIGRNAEVQEGALIRGPFALCEGAVVNMGAKIRGDTSIGPYSKVGGEISNSVVFGYSNKGHDGFMGNSVLGEWCNLGADTNTSNLKNNYSSVKVWSYPENKIIETGIQFCGLLMGDHSKAGINTMFNTGTVVGVSANVFGGGFPPKFVASFAWGGSEGFQKYDFSKSIDTARKVMQRRGVQLTEEEVGILKKVHSEDYLITS